METQLSTQTVSKKTSTRRVLYYADLLGEKLDLHTDGFIKRIEAQRIGDKERVEFVEEMMIKPLDKQIVYLAGKLSSLIQGKEENGQRN